MIFHLKQILEQMVASLKEPKYLLQIGFTSSSILKGKISNLAEIPGQFISLKLRGLS